MARRLVLSLLAFKKGTLPAWFVGARDSSDADTPATVLGWRAMSVSRHAPAIFAVFALASLMAAAWPFTIDDAFIVGRYADRLARGRGYTYEDGIVSDGVSGPLWLLPL
ncbi:MAG TPA: hypothetical protein VG963_29375, partial [Polyangiaceae bacterium]|nr:hypothetical protein [Polyangiaceae bacterium]